MLAEGGNAVDAAVCAAACLTVTEPTSNGLGGDLFALVWDGARVHALDASGRAPGALTAEHVRTLGHTTMPTEGWLPVTVPGQVSGWGALLERAGSLPLQDVLAPAIHLAREGFPVGPITAGAWARAAGRFAAFDEWGRVFAPGGRTPAPGEVFVNPDLGASLATIAAGGPEAFYTALGSCIADHAGATGGFLTAEDFERHAPQWVEPLRVRYGRWHVVEAAPPTQGFIAASALGMLYALDTARGATDAATGIHRAIEATKRAFADGYATLADPDVMDASAAGLLSPDRLARRSADIDDNHAGPSPAEAALLGGTVLVCAGDSHGRLVSLIQSNFYGFGSGIVVPGTGIALQNRGAGFRLDPNHPDVLAPGKKPFHTILPGLLLDRHSGDGVAAFGVMGGQMQPQGHVQVVSGLARGATPQQALDAPRWRWTDAGTLLLEDGFDAATIDELARRGHEIADRSTHPRHFGGGQIVMRDRDGALVAGSDRRKDGHAAWARESDP